MFSSVVGVVLHILFLLVLRVDAVPVAGASASVSAAFSSASSASSSSYWVGSIKRQGTIPFGNNTSYQIYRNVKDFGATGDGSTDDTDAINKAISSGGRCGEGCDSSTTTPALVYFPPGTYLVSKPIVQYYYTQMVGDANDLPVLKAAASFTGMAVIDSDPYETDGSNWYTNQNNFFRAIRNFVIDLTAMPESAGAGIHWQVGQATSLQNIRFEMIQGGGSANKQEGIFMDNGSGGFMSDLTFNGGNYGMFLGNQQFTTRNLTFNNCNTAIYMNWDWAWTFKSVTVNNCGVGINMSTSPSNQTVGSVLLLDSTIDATTAGIVTAFTSDSIPVGGGVLVLDNVDFTSSSVAVAGISGNTILAGGSVVENWVQGDVYTSSSGATKRSAPLQRREIIEVEVIEYEIIEECPDSGCSQATSASTSGTESRFPFATVPVAVPTVNIAVTIGSGSEHSGGAATSSKSTATAVVAVDSSSSTTTSVIGVASSHAAGVAGSLSHQHATVASSSAVFGTAGEASCAAKTVTRTRVQTTMPTQAKPSSLLTSSGKIYERSKPLYESYPASSFVSVKSAGAKGDGTTDDTAVLQKVFDSVTEDQIVYFDHGAYIITSTLKVPKNIKITGEVWPMLMAYGDKFADEKNPIPMLQIGESGEVGSVELSDLILETKGPAPGAILMQWNLAAETQGSAGMWDVHTRLGGSAGTELQSNTCPKTPSTTTTPNPDCIAAFLMFHLTANASAYVENAWFWTADHELDLSDHSQIDVYTGRGVLVESTNAVWLYGTAAEHNQLYNYQVSGAKNVFMGLIQTETPYYQSNPDALTPFTPQTSWADPDFSTCTTASCRKSWGLRVLDTTDLWVYGAGLYSFFDNYSQTCLDTESCQENIVQVDCSEVYLYGLSTKASTNMITSSSGEALVLQDENESTYCSTIAFFEQ
ncbi:hypothetical protein ASPZODRAFT_68840 [Penicilliopsis zonata CBS 506.65]|uniref:Rhamnogalacturonase A/B/Epimerase-like pectate lyase domain-containing protein n=1 Tax=Penicilliopsis zonata CBS 506.65 TaxID=1073090 RepID=A0A1L9SEW8_9EURO|nr:hypothetical protein ASPZODRAFT_68840 [Penicilliopsis zonata CBS 506.65]OJJ45637.1 hypothetical protein ASPZODRAFT_68840 [Penicilliopsis zonata CBS 506.65]